MCCLLQYITNSCSNGSSSFFPKIYPLLKQHPKANVQFVNLLLKGEQMKLSVLFWAVSSVWGCIFPTWGHSHGYFSYCRGDPTKWFRSAEFVCKVSKKLSQRCQCYYNTGQDGLIQGGAKSSLMILNISHSILPLQCYGASWSTNLPKALKQRS